MKSKKSIFGLIIIVMILILGIGYAIVTSVDLTISGTASSESRDLDVVISAASPNNTTSDVYGTVNTPNDLTATIHVANMQTVGERKSVTYTIHNNETDLAASVVKKSITPTNNAYFRVTTSVDSSPVVVQPSGDVTVTVTVELLDIPITSTDSQANIVVVLEATPTPPSP